MRYGKHIVVGVTGLLFGIIGTMVLANPLTLLRYESNRHLWQPQEAAAAANDRYGDYVMCTGAVAVNPRSPEDGVWMLDYRSGKLLGTVIDRTVGKILGWAEVDLVTEYNIPPRTDVHFMMTTGTITQGQAALYVAEVTTGKFGVYTMGPADAGGIIIRRHDLTTFRANKPVPVPVPVAPAAPQLQPVQGQPAPLPPVPIQPAPVLPAVPDPNKALPMEPTPIQPALPPLPGAPALPPVPGAPTLPPVPGAPAP
jgi:hypothetical protein